MGAPPRVVTALAAAAAPLIPAPSSPEPDVVAQQPKSKSRQRLALEVSCKTAIAVVGLRIGVSVLKGVGRLLFGKGGAPAGKRPSKFLQEAAVAQPLPVVSPSAHWAPLDAEVPSVPPDYKVLVTATLPCSVYTLYHNVISQQSSWLQQQHEQIDKQYNYAKTAWQPAPATAADYPVPDDHNMLQGLGRSVFDFALGAAETGAQPGTFVRTVSFVAPPKPPNSSDTRCVQRQQLCVGRGGTLVLATAMNMLDIPFKESFMVNTAWRVEPGAGPGQGGAGTCTLTIYGKVHFIKGTLVAGLIRATTFRDLNSFYKKVMENLQALMATAAPVPEPSSSSRAGAGSGAWAGARALVRTMSSTHAGPSGTSGAGAAHQRRLPFQELPTASKQPLAYTMPVGKQLRVLLVLTLLLVSVAHQVLLHQELLQVRRELGLAPLDHVGRLRDALEPALARLRGSLGL